VAGENDLAQNPFDLRAEQGRSLFDATNRFVFSGTYALPRWRSAQGALKQLVNGPGLASVDLSLFKNFAITESSRVQLRAEAFNTLNHPNFMLPENDLASPEFGQILQAAPPRLLQLALKFIF
jgi:hypothetical protein